MRFRIKDQGSRIKDQASLSRVRERGWGGGNSSILNPERSSRSLSHGNHTAYLLRVQSSKGFTLIELIVVIIIIVTLMGFFMNRVSFYQEQAEKVAMEGVVGAIQSALILQYGQLQTRGKSSDIATLIQDNPMNWMQKKPANYAGEFFEPTLKSASSGNWIFDLKTREMVYLVRNGTHLNPGAGHQPWIRFHVVTQLELSRLPSLQNNPPELTGILFEPVESYTWF